MTDSEPRSIPRAFVGRSVSDIAPGNDSFMCVALVRNGSAIAEAWPTGKPVYCIYEYTAWAVRKHEIRWGDGSGQDLVNPEDFDSIVLLREFGEDALDWLLNN